MWDVIAEMQIDTDREYANLWKLVTYEDTALRKGSFNLCYSIYEVCKSNFIKFNNRGSFISLEEMLIEFDLLTYNGQFINQVTIDDLDLFIEVLLWLLSELKQLDMYEFTDIEYSIHQNIEIILQKTNQKLVNISSDKRDIKLIVVLDDEFVTSAAELILPDDETLALSVLGYSHYSHKDDIVSKRNILKQLANYVEPKLKKQKDSNIGFALNNWNVRHNNDNELNVTDEQLNEMYDKLYRDILYYLLGAEHREFDELVSKMKQEKK